MRHGVILTLMGVTLGCPVAAAWGQGAETEAAPATNAAVLLQKGIYTEETAGDIDGAIGIYREVIAQARVARKHAAEAHYRLARCYLKKKDEQGAAAELRRLLRSYSDVAPIAGRARAELGKLEPQDVPRLPYAVMSCIADEHLATWREAQANGLRANTHIYGVDDEFNLHSGGLLTYRNDTGRPDAGPIRLGNFGKTRPDFWLMDEQGQAQDYQVRLNSGKRIGRYALWWEPDEPVKPGGLRLLGYLKRRTRGLPAQDGKAELVMNNHFGSPVLENFFLVLPYNMTVEGASAEQERPKHAGNFRIHQWQKHVPSDTTHQVKVILARDPSAMPPAGVAPRVVRTLPTAFSNDVDPSLDEITVTFDRPMMDKSWSFTGGGETFPGRTGEVAYDAGRTTCTMPVKLQAGKVYWVGVNSPAYRNFKSAEGVPAARYVILFTTAAADGKSTPIPEDLLSQARQINVATATMAERVDVGKASALVESMRGLMAGVYAAVEQDDPATALTLLQQEIAQGRQLLEVVAGTPAEPPVRAGLPMLERIETALLAKDYGQARKLLETLNTMGPSLDRSIKQGLEAATRAPRTAPPAATDRQAAEDLANEGWRLWRERKLADAEANFEEAVGKDPTFANAWNGLGWSQLNQGKPANAREAFAKAVACDPKHAAALNGLGWIARGEGNAAEAIAYWEQAVAALPTATAAWNGLATIYTEQGRYDEAAAAYQAWLRGEPNNADARAGLRKAREAGANAKGAKAAARQWLVLVDAGRYAESWEAAAGYFRKAVSKDVWQKQLRTARAPLGDVRARELMSAVYATSLPGAPDGEYVMIQYGTGFENKAQAVETVTPMMDDDGTWRVSGYYIK